MSNQALVTRATNLCQVSIAGITTVRQWLILCAILDKEGLTAQDLIGIVGKTRAPNQKPIAKATVTSACNRLEDAGFIKILRAKNLKNKNGGHPRCHYYLTEKGRKLAEMGVSS